MVGALLSAVLLVVEEGRQKVLGVVVLFPLQKGFSGRSGQVC